MSAKVNYERYLRSRRWRRLKGAHIKRYGKRCRACGGAGRDLHHKTYERLGNERLSDLALLCERCHVLLHQLEREGLTTLDPAGLFDQDRAREYAETRTDRRTADELAELAAVRHARRQATEEARDREHRRRLDDRRAVTQDQYDDLARKYGGGPAKLMYRVLAEDPAVPGGR